MSAIVVEENPRHAETLLMAYFGDRTLREVAAPMGVPEATAKSQARSGLRQLRLMLAESPRPV